MMRPTFRLFALFCAAIVVAACEQPASETALQPVEVPASGESLAPQVFNAAGVVSLSWLERTGEGHALRYATWQDGKWGEAREVARGQDWFANWADLPGVRALQDGGWVAWWLQKSAPATYAYDVQLAFSEDGAVWKPYGTPHDDGTPTEHGFVTAFDRPAGGLGLAWLDGRNTGGGGHGAHAGHGGMTLRYALFDRAGEIREEAQFDALTCDCCQTDSAASGDAVVMAYRDRTEAEIRDIHVARFADGKWSAPARVHADNWKIDGCPVNGPAIVADGERVGVAWFTAPQGQGEVRFAWSHDGGRTFEAPVRLDTGRPLGRVDAITVPGRGVAVTWVEQGESGAAVRLRMLDSDGDAGEPKTIVHTDAGRAGGFPRMAVLPTGDLILAWTVVDGAAREVRTAVVQP